MSVFRGERLVVGMRYVTVRVTHAEGEAFHPLGAAVADEPAVTTGPIHQLELIDGDTGVSLSEIRGGDWTATARSSTRRRTSSSTRRRAPTAGSPTRTSSWTT